jgi:hypothetical protein
MAKKSRKPGPMYKLGAPSGSQKRCKAPQRGHRPSPCTTPLLDPETLLEAAQRVLDKVSPKRYIVAQ